MRPPLLKKQEIDVLKAKEKAQAIAEGLKLTRRIDGLRELEAETEENYQKFASATLQTLNERIVSATKEAEGVEGKLKERKDELEKLLGPADKAWLYYTRSKKAEIDSQLNVNTSRGDELARAKALAEQRTKEALENKAKSDALIAENALGRKEIEQLKYEAREVLASARNDAHIIGLKANETEFNAQKKLEEVLRYEQSLKEKEEALTKYEADIEKREFIVLSKELALASPVKQL